MRHNFKWMRPIQQQHEGAPIAPGAIITWRKSPFEQKVRTFYHTFDYAEEAKRIDYVSKYEYECYIDLWFIKVRMAWIGREQKAPNA